VRRVTSSPITLADWKKSDRLERQPKNGGNPPDADNRLALFIA
jgi:hypothetical protein